MMRRYYSQTGEDALAWSVFQDRPTGFFVEVGAFDGRHGSNSLSFEEAGWIGICVEPHPDYAGICRANRPGSTCIRAACVGPGHGPTVRFLSEPLGVLSGINAHQTPGLPERYGLRSMTFPGFSEIEVTARTLDDIIAEHHAGLSEIDWLSIDVEGTEIDVMRGLSIPARVICAEANTDPARDELKAFMASCGYVYATSLSQNYFFSVDESTANTLASASFDITTELTQHPLGPQATVANHSGQRIRRVP